MQAEKLYNTPIGLTQKDVHWQLSINRGMSTHLESCLQAIWKGDREKDWLVAGRFINKDPNIIVSEGAVQELNSLPGICAADNPSWPF